MKITPSCGNVFADLGLPNPNALLLLADARRKWDATVREPIPQYMADLLRKMK